MPVMNLRRRFHLPMRDVEPLDQFIIANTSKRKVALWVDSIADVVEASERNIVIKEMIEPGAEDIEGVMILDDGMLLIYNLERMLSPEEEALFDSIDEEQKSELD